MKKIIMIIIALILMLVVIGCQKAKSEKHVVLVLLKTMDNPFFISIEKGFRENWTNQNVSIDYRAGTKEGDVTAHRQILESYIDKYVANKKNPSLDGVVITPASSGNELVPQIKKLRDNNVPVIIVDTRINKEALEQSNTNYSAFIGSSNKDGGVLAAELVAKHLPSGGNILLLNGLQGQETATQRREGFMEKMQEFHKIKNITFKVTERSADWRRVDAHKILEGFITQGKSFDAIFAANDQMAIGAVQAYKAKNMPVPIIIGFDAIDEAIELVKTKELKGTIAQSPYNMGKKAAELLQTIVKNNILNEDFIIPVNAVE